MLQTKADVIFEQGFKQGLEEGKKEVLNLLSFLVHHGKTDDVLKASLNLQYMGELLAKFKSGELAAACT